MTEVDNRPTSTGTTPRQLLRRHRATLAVGGGLLVVLMVLAVVTRAGPSGSLDPDAYDPTGSHALATLLRDRGVNVQRITDVPTGQARATDATTVFVPLTASLSTDELSALGALPGKLVVAGAGPPTLAGLDRSEHVQDFADVDTLDPGCSLAAARRAGRAEMGGFVFETDGEGVQGCYPIPHGGPTLLSVPDQELVLVGSTDAFTNGRLDKQGNAALALGLLGQSETVLWLVPAADRAAFGDRPHSNPDELLPDWVTSARLQLLVALGVLALWRARRLGRVVPEPLPVVVRASETAEGRGRMYRAAGARGTAAEALRSGARDRLAPRVGAGRNPDPTVLCELLTARTPRSAVELQRLLYGPAPADDAALVRLADDLDTLIREVAGS